VERKEALPDIRHHYRLKAGDGGMVASEIYHQRWQLYMLNRKERATHRTGGRQA
jgi:hypothetical protein